MLDGERRVDGFEIGLSGAIAPDWKVFGGYTFMKSEIVVTNVRVLAIGQNVQERNGEKFITSQTATLELDPRQTEQVVLAQRQGTLALALRSLQDAAKNDERIDDGSSDRRPLTLVRFGVQSDLVAK